MHTHVLGNTHSQYMPICKRMQCGRTSTAISTNVKGQKNTEAHRTHTLAYHYCVYINLWTGTKFIYVHVNKRTCTGGRAKSFNYTLGSWLLLFLFRLYFFSSEKNRCASATIVLNIHSNVCVCVCIFFMPFPGCFCNCLRPESSLFQLFCCFFPSRSVPVRFHVRFHGK